MFPGSWFGRAAGLGRIVEKMPECEMKKATLSRFLANETGQDLVEYSLLLAFIALAEAAAFMGMSNEVNTIWSAANNHLAAANGS